MHVNSSEAFYSLDHYTTFNDFFTRALKPSCRPVDQSIKSVTSPVDGRVIEYGDIRLDQIWQIKGMSFSMHQLIHNISYRQQFINGQFISFYIAPKDYHRIHAPYKLKLLAVEYHPGDLYPVNRLGLRWIPNLFVVNERMNTFFEYDSFGLGVLVKVAALNVGGIQTQYSLPWSKKYIQTTHNPLFTTMRPLSYHKGQELALFSIGSTVILLFEGRKISFNSDIRSGSFFKMGDSFARFY